MSGLRIVLLSREYPPDTGWGGIGTYSFNLARGLAWNGHRVTVIALSLASRSETTSGEGVIIRRIPSSSHPKISQCQIIRDMLAHSSAVARELARISRDRGIDIIEFPDWWAEGLACTGLFRRFAPSVARVHGYSKLIRRLHHWPTSSGFRLRAALEGRALRGANVIVPNTDWIAEKVANDYKLPSSKIRTQPMGIDSELFRADATSQRRLDLRDRLGLAANARVILSCGRYEPRKGFDNLIRALSILKRRLVDAYLVFAGGGRDQRFGDVLMELARNEGVLDRVRFCGPIPYTELPAWYAMCDIYAGASRGESPGLTYLEAMACRRPVVALNDGGIPEVVKHMHTGILVDPEKSELLAPAIELLVTAPDLGEQMGEAGERRFNENFALSVVVPQQVKLYYDVLAQV